MLTSPGAFQPDLAERPKQPELRRGRGRIPGGLQWKSRSSDDNGQKLGNHEKSLSHNDSNQLIVVMIII